MVQSADLGRRETLAVESMGTAGPNGCVRLVRVEVNDPHIGSVGINVDLADLAQALRQFGLMFPGDALQQSDDDTVWMS